MRIFVAMLVVALAACGGAQAASSAADAPAAGAEEGTGAEAGAEDPAVDHVADGPACWCGEPVDPACVDTCAAHDALEGAAAEE